MSKFEKISVRDFAKKKICDGHLFFVNKEGRKYYLMKPGVLVDPQFIKKHATHNTIFDLQTVINNEVKDKFSLLFRELRYSRFEKDLRMKSLEIMKYFHKTFSSSEHFLSFAVAAFEEFSSLTPEMTLKLHETDMFLFRKALYSASYAVILGIGNDFYHSNMLKDFFNLTMTLDIGLCDTNYSYYVAQACNVENQKPGFGRNWLVNEKASELEAKVFADHPQKSYRFLKEHENILAHPELAEVALYQHELADGKGFPRGISKSLVSSWESIVLLADSMVEIQDDYKFENSVIEYMLNFQNQKLNDLPVTRVYKKFCQNLQYFKEMKESVS